MKAIVDTISINASKDQVWPVLTDPKYTPEYMYGCAIESDMKAGSEVHWRSTADQVVYVSGKIKEIKAPDFMFYTVIDPHADYEQSEENHLDVEYVLEESQGSTFLTVTQSGFDTAAEGQKRYDESVAAGGWKSVLEKIKEIAERG